MADLLGSILGSMDTPPTPSDKEKEKTKELKKQFEKEQKLERARREDFRKKIVRQIGVFIEDGSKKRVKFSPMDKVLRSIIHEVAETAGLIAHSFGTEEVDRHIILFKKEYAPTDEELHALRNGEVYDPASTSASKRPSVDDDTLIPHKPTPVTVSTNYRDKYKHLIATEIDEPVPIKTVGERNYGFVPSSNKRDIRSIEETLSDIRSKKKAKMDIDNNG